MLLGTNIYKIHERLKHVIFGLFFFPFFFKGRVCRTNGSFQKIQLASLCVSIRLAWQSGLIPV